MTSSPTLERRYSEEEYEALEDRIMYELVDGQLVERHVSYMSSVVAILIAEALSPYARENRLGMVFGSDLGIRIHAEDPAHTRRADVGFISSSSAPADDVGYLRVAPDLVVEVVSPGDTSQELRLKVDEWLEHGVRMAWVAFPASREIHVYAADAHPQIFTADDEIDAGDVLPGFRCPVARLFPER